ncbi:MAG: TerD family protein [Rhodospirillales bacterium]|nr:TerD family protein [Rhodospirillales bacterium]MCB9964764.1 TerD family protein [Rhodospirillales bacterium]MCB9973764.1 TerD family protein [Rhodospirillales bacterium]MCB9980656.1 TerD family protein [Rhodospirillales bacterium]
MTDNSPTDHVKYVASSQAHLDVGQDVGLTNKDPTLTKLLIGSGWDIRTMEGDPPDLDLSCFILDKNEQTRKDQDFVFYNNLSSEEGEVVHKGDSRTGAGDGDDEQIHVDLNSLPYEVAELVLILSIHDGEIKEQDFTMVTNLFVRLVNLDSGFELFRLKLSDEFLSSAPGVALRIGRIFRDGPKWRFHSNTEFIEKGGLRTAATKYGIIVL